MTNNQESFWFPVQLTTFLSWYSIILPTLINACQPLTRLSYQWTHYFRIHLLIPKHFLQILKNKQKRLIVNNQLTYYYHTLGKMSLYWPSHSTLQTWDQIDQDRMTPLVWLYQSKLKHSPNHYPILGDSCSCKHVKILLQNKPSSKHGNQSLSIHTYYMFTLHTNIRLWLRIITLHNNKGYIQIDILQ